MQNIYNLFYDKSNDVVDFFKYGVFGFPTKELDVPNRIEITVHSSPDSLWLESPEYPGIFASGSNAIELWESLNDAIYSYFEVPRYVAKKLGNKFYLPLPDGSTIAERPSEELARA